MNRLTAYPAVLSSRSFSASISSFNHLILLFGLVFLLEEYVDGSFGINSNKVKPIIKMVNPGDRIHIPCSVMSPGGSVQWIRNGKPILLDFSPTQRRHWNISNDGQASLTINRVTKTDEGVWECWELDSLGNVKQKATVMKLVVANIPQEPYIELEGRKLAHQATITVRENNIIKLHCICSGASPAVRQINWYLAGQNITQSSQLLMEYSTEEDNYDSRSFVLVNITKNLHAKMIICQAEHISWLRPAVVSASFNVLYEPSFAISRDPGFGYPIIEGMPVSLKCEIDANPTSKAKWVKDSENSKNGLPIQFHEGYLNFSSIKVTDSGWFRCTTDHEFGHFASFGYYLNVRSELPKLQHVLKLPLSPLHPARNSIHKEATDSVHRLGVEPEQSGAAKPSFQAASVSNSMDIMVNSGFYNNQQKLNSLQTLYGEENQQQRQECGNNNSNNNGKPVIVGTNRTIVAIERRPISLSVDFCCNPQPNKVYWIHRHLAMGPGRIIGPYVTKELIMTSNSRDCYTSSFDIESVKPEDAGEITFIVRNSRGLGDVLILLNVTRASFSVSEASSHQNNEWSLLLLVTEMIIVILK